MYATSLGDMTCTPLNMQTCAAGAPCPILRVRRAAPRACTRAHPPGVGPLAQPHGGGSAARVVLVAHSGDVDVDHELAVDDDEGVTAAAREPIGDFDDAAAGAEDLRLLRIVVAVA